MFSSESQKTTELNLVLNSSIDHGTPHFFPGRQWKIWLKRIVRELPKPPTLQRKNRYIAMRFITNKYTAQIGIKEFQNDGVKRNSETTIFLNIILITRAENN